MKYKNIIFDFDGVLAESVNIKAKAFYKIYEPYGEEIAEKALRHHNENGGMSRFEKFVFYHKVFLNHDLTRREIKSLSTKFSNIIVQDVITSNEVPGAFWFLKKYLKKNKWIVSATPEDEICTIVEKRNMSIYFKKVYGSPEGKISIVKKIISENNLKKDETIFLGDAVTDFKAAEVNNIDFALRRTPENKLLFLKSLNLIIFEDFYSFDKQING